MKNGDLIYRQELHDELTVMAANGAKSHIRAYARCVNALELVPAVDAEPIRHGHWIQAEGKAGIWYCSECGERISYNQNRRTYKPAKKPVHVVNRRCRSCGARMDGDTGAKS